MALTWVARRTSAPNLHHNLYSPSFFFCFVFVFNIYLAIASLRARGIFSYSMRFRPGALEAQSLNQGSPSISFLPMLKAFPLVEIVPFIP